MPKIKTLKQALTVIGLMGLGLLTFSFVPEAFAQVISGTDQPSAISALTGGSGSLREMILRIVNYALSFLGLVAVIMVIYGGMLYVTAAGEQEQVDKGKKILMYAVTGIVIIALSFALVNTVLGGFRGTTG